MKWGASTDRLLLLAILENHNITIDYEAVACSIGNGCSEKAVYTQLLKLRKMATERKSKSSPVGPNPIKKTAGRGGKQKENLHDDDEDVKNFKPRPFLQRKVKTESSQPKVKEEKKEAVIKKENGQPEARRKFQFSGDIIVIDDDDDE